MLSNQVVKPAEVDSIGTHNFKLGELTSYQYLISVELIEDLQQAMEEEGEEE